MKVGTKNVPKNVFSEAVARCSVKKVFLEISQNSQENTCARASFLIKFKVAGLIIKEALVQVLSCEFCEISKNTFSYRTNLRWLLLFFSFHLMTFENTNSSFGGCEDYARGSFVEASQYQPHFYWGDNSQFDILKRGKSE